MKLIVDINLTPRWLSLLVDAGIEAEHWSTLGASNALDSEIMAHDPRGHKRTDQEASDCLQLASNSIGLLKPLVECNLTGL